MSDAVKFVCWLGGGFATVLTTILVGPLDPKRCQGLSTSVLPSATDPCLNRFGFEPSAYFQAEVAAALGIFFFVLPFIVDALIKEYQAKRGLQSRLHDRGGLPG